MNPSTIYSRDVTRRPDKPPKPKGRLHYLMGWLTVPIEVIFRRNFGERWLILTNFAAGLLVLFLFSGLQWAYHWLVAHVPSFLASVDLYTGDVSPIALTPAEQLRAHSMLPFFAAYLLLGFFHAFRSLFRRRTAQSLHTFEDGTSWFQIVGRLLVWPINLLAMPFVYLLMPFLMPRREWRFPAPALIKDVTAFTNIVVDPLLLLAMAWWIQDVTGVWLVLSAIAMFVHAIEKYMKKRKMMQNFNDSIVEAEIFQRQMNIVEPQRHVRPKRRWRWLRKQKQATPEYGELDGIIDSFHQEHMSYRATKVEATQGRTGY